MATSVHALDTLPGLSSAHAQGLAQLGLTSTDQLFRYGQSAERQQALAKRLQVPLRYVAKWVILSELARVPAVGCQANGLLLHAGIISVQQLADCSTQGLYTRLRRLHVATLQRNDLCPTADQVSLWINQAKALKNGTLR
jgi:predicted flap endonuclease-1-like 5' DNA nuclease